MQERAAHVNFEEQCFDLRQTIARLELDIEDAKSKCQSKCEQCNSLPMKLGKAIKPKDCSNKPKVKSRPKIKHKGMNLSLLYAQNQNEGCMRWVFCLMFVG